MKNALVVYKKSLYQIYVQERENTHIKHLMDSGNVTVKDLLAAHKSNEKTLEHVLAELGKAGFNVRSRYRGDASMVKDADIVFSVGGDGTLLWTQKFVGSGVPVFGVNSDPGRSVGYLCTADEITFAHRLRDFLLPEHIKTYGSPMCRTVQRLQVKVNGEVITNRALNDVLFCHKNPAATCSYIINGESQKSSGIWFSTAVGSSGAMKSSGGTLQQWHDDALQYKVREPYEVSTTYKNKKGLFKSPEKVTLVSKMREAIIAPDGARDLCSIKMGDEIEISHSTEPLTWVKI